MELESWINQTTAEQLMNCELVKLRPDMLMSDAAAVLLKHQISGAPVVGDNGVCVGVLSAADFVKVEESVADERRRFAESSFWNSNLVLPENVYAAKLAEVRDKLIPAAEHMVAQVMTRDLVTVSLYSPLATIMQRMVDGHIHRVFVLDSDDRLVGIVSSNDILTALLQAAPD